MDIKNPAIFLESQESIFSTHVGFEAALEKIIHVMHWYEGHFCLENKKGIDYLKNLSNPITAVNFTSYIKSYLLEYCFDVIDDIADSRVDFDDKNHTLTISFVVILKKDYVPVDGKARIKLGFDVIK